mgnify:CR=1 FL=1
MYGSWWTWLTQDVRTLEEKKWLSSTYNFQMYWKTRLNELASTNGIKLAIIGSFTSKKCFFSFFFCEGAVTTIKMVKFEILTTKRGEDLLTYFQGVWLWKKTRDGRQALKFLPTLGTCYSNILAANEYWSRRMTRGF